MPIPTDQPRIAWDLSRILLPLSFVKRYGGFAAAALAVPAALVLFSRAGGLEAMILGGTFGGLVWWALRFWALRRAVRAFDERFPEWSSERPVALGVLKTMTAEPGAGRLYAALPGFPQTVVVEASVKGSVTAPLVGSAVLELLQKYPNGLTITQTSVNGKVEVLVNGKPADPELATQLLKGMPPLASGEGLVPSWLPSLGTKFSVMVDQVLNANATVGANGGPPVDQKIQDAVAALDTGFEPIPVQGNGTGASPPAGASGSSPQQRAPRWMPLQPDEHQPAGESDEKAEGK